MNLVDWILTIAAMVVSWQIHAAVLRQPPGADSPGSHPAGGDTPLTPRQMAPLGEELEHAWQSGALGDLSDFLTGATLAYEQVVVAFATGDLHAILPLLGPAVREAFGQAIAERQARGESLSTTVIGLTAEPVDAGLDGGTAWVEVRFAVDLVSALTDRGGAVVGGNPRQVVRATEVWTFTREVASADPNWMLVATEEDG